MIPDNELTLNNTTQMDILQYDSLTYKVNFEANRVMGFIDNFDSIYQAAIKILNTERNVYPIYSTNYGIELERMIGKDFDFIKADMERVLKEALLADDRIQSVNNLAIEKTGLNDVMVSFEVITLTGQANISMEVMV